MSCIEVRDRLADYSLGTLRSPDAQEVDRHLEWCAGCRKEAAELQEGVATVAFSMPVEVPPSYLERDIVERIATAAGRRKNTPRRGVFALAAATLTAMLLAVGSFGWAIAERNRAADLELQRRQGQEELKELERLLETFPDAREGGLSLQAELKPLVASQGFGRVVIFSAPKVDDWILVDLVPPAPESGSYTVRVLDEAATPIVGGSLNKATSGDWIYLETRVGRDLSEAASISVRDGSGRPVLLGLIKPYARASIRPPDS
jgi:hypothetical protein